MTGDRSPVRAQRRTPRRVDGERNPVVEPPHEVAGDRHALGEGPGLRIADPLVVVGLHLPFVDRVGLPDIDGEEIRPVAVAASANEVWTRPVLLSISSPSASA